MASSPGNTREVLESHYLEIPPRAGSPRANSSSYLSVGAGSCPQKATVLSCLERELHDDAFPSHAHHRYCDTGSGTGKCPVDSEAFEIDCRSSPCTLLYC